MPVCRKQTCFSTPAESVFHCYSVKSGYTDITATKTVFIFIDMYNRPRKRIETCLYTF